jgi:hypothetical protein
MEGAGVVQLCWKVRGLRHTDGMSHGRSRRALGSASGIVRARIEALAARDSH